jgi:hypothetical protein
VDFRDGLIVSDRANERRGGGESMKRLMRHPMIDVAIKALGRNRLQTGLTMLGITVGVATVLAMMAVGAGAQRSIEQQVRAAGLTRSRFVPATGGRRTPTATKHCPPG